MYWRNSAKLYMKWTKILIFIPSVPSPNTIVKGNPHNRLSRNKPFGCADKTLSFHQVSRHNWKNNPNHLRTTVDSKCLERKKKKSRKVKREEKKRKTAKMETGNYMSQNQKVRPRVWAFSRTPQPESRFLASGHPVEAGLVTGNSFNHLHSLQYHLI